MKHPHFFSAYSRLGLINPPHGSSAFNYGVETAPDYILDHELLSRFAKYKVDAYHFPRPEDLSKNEYQGVIAKQSLEFAKLINQQLSNYETQVVIGGDHSVAFGAVLALLGRYTNDEIAYIHFDSHADTCSMTDSPSQNFHGQFLRALIDPNFDHKSLRSLAKQNLLAKNTVIIGDLEADDFDYIREAEINYFKGTETPIIVAKLEELCRTIKHLHISFDIDVFKKNLVRATGTPNHWGGLDRPQIWPILDVLAKHQNLSIDLVEVNPQKDGAKETIALAKDVLLKLLQVSH